MKTKKSQIYGLNAFLFSLAIAIILIVAMVGTTKEFENMSRAGIYRVSGLLTMRSAEQLKLAVDQERRYAFDKSLFMTGAYGGYLSYEDMIGTKNCNYLPFCNSICDGAECVDGTPNCATTVRTDINGNLISSGSCYCVNADGDITFVETPERAYCYPTIVSDPANEYCGAKYVGVDHLPEKNIPYWRNYGIVCIPEVQDITSNVEDYASKSFSISNRIITSLLDFFSSRRADLNYVLDIKHFDEHNIETAWFPIGNTRLTIKDNPTDPIVSYSFNPFVHTYPTTGFFGLYSESKSFVEGLPFHYYLFNLDTGILPLVIDNRYLVKRYNESGQFSFDPPSPRESFKSIVNVFKDTTNYPHHPNGPANCESILSASGISNDYSGTCRINMTKGSNGALIILEDEWDNCVHPNPDTQNALKCIMWKIAEKINIDLNLRGADSNWKPPLYFDEDGPGPSSELGWNYDFEWIVITFNGATTTDTFYNTSLYENPDHDCSDCLGAQIVKGYNYAESDLVIGIHRVGYSGSHKRYTYTVQPTVNFATINPDNTFGQVYVQMYGEKITGFKKVGDPILVQFNNTHTIVSGGSMSYTVHDIMLGYRQVKFCIEHSDNAQYPGDSAPYCESFNMEKVGYGWLPTTPSSGVWTPVDGSEGDACGNGVCDGSIGENGTNCPIDCHCGPLSSTGGGDGVCNAAYTFDGSDWTQCASPEDDPDCISTNEDWENCPEDCEPPVESSD